MKSPIKVPKIRVLLLSFGFACSALAAPPAFVPVCDRTPVIRDRLVAVLKKTCAEITAGDLSTIYDFSLSTPVEYRDWKASDFQGLPLLRLALRHVHLKVLPPDMLLPFSELQVLDVRENEITEIPADLFHSTPLLKYIGLASNPLPAVPLAAFDGLWRLQTVDFQLTKLSATTSKSLYQALTGNPWNAQVLY